MSLKIRTIKEKVAQNSPATATVVKVGVFFLHLKETEKIEKPNAEARPKIRPGSAVSYTHLRAHETSLHLE